MNPSGMLRLTNPKITGAGEHRSGWPYVVDALQPLLGLDGPIMLDDFVERTFLYNNRATDTTVHREPWVAIMHHPPDMPSWYMPECHLQKLAGNPRFQESLPALRMIVSLGEPLTAWLRRQWPAIPVVEIKHPTGRPLLDWTPTRWRQNRERMLVQVGWFLRNLSGIYQVVGVSPILKAHLANVSPIAKRMEWLCRREMTQVRPKAPWDAAVVQLPKQDDTWYDVLLAENIVFAELLTAVANNTVIECIARNTPIVVNRHPGPEAYLGADYPLFFDRLADVPALLTEDRILAAHQHLKALDKWWIRGTMFCEQLRAACIQHIPELSASSWARADQVDAYL